MFKKKAICYVLLSKNKLWVVFKKQVVHAQTYPHPLLPKQVVQACSQCPCSKVILFLEPPWILQIFQNTISLSQKDAFQYSRNILGFHHLNPEKFSKIGVAFFDLSEKNKKGLLVAALPSQTLQLIENFQKTLHIKAVPLPFLYAGLSAILKHTSEALLFYGLGQATFIHKQKHALQQVAILPESITNASMHPIVNDYLCTVFKNIDSLYLNESLVLSLTKQWKRAEKNSKFVWETQRASWKIHWKWIALLGYLGFMVFLMLGYFSVKKNNEGRQHQIEQSQKHIQQIQNHLSKAQNHTFQQERFMQMNMIYQELNISVVLTQKVLQQIIAPMNEHVWIEQFSYENHQVDLRLLALKPTAIPKILEALTKVSIVEKAALKSQEMVQLDQNNVIKFDLQIDLNPNDVQSIQATKAPFIQ